MSRTHTKKTVMRRSRRGAAPLCEAPLSALVQGIEDGGLNAACGRVGQLPGILAGGGGSIRHHLYHCNSVISDLTFRCGVPYFLQRIEGVNPPSATTGCIMKDLSKENVRDVFFAPMKTALNAAKNSRECRKFSDWQHLTSGVGRCLEPVQSGRDWIQRLRHMFSLKVRVSSFFESLTSKRRLRLAQEVNDSVIARNGRRAASDCFAEHRELDNFGIYAGDGHYHECSVHEQEIGGRRRPVGHFFAIDLRTLLIRHLDVARPTPACRKEHDITVLKRLDSKTLRMGEPRGRKVIIAYDKAVVDFVQWYKWKKAKGVYIVTREKENMALLCCGNRSFDRNDPRNNGVVSDEQVGTSKNTLIRRITYVDPADAKKYVFITNEMTLPPGLVAFIYKKRWTIEKVFDQLKNKLRERKAWAKSATAKCQQAVFMCLAHNLMLIFERRIEAEEGITDRKILDRRKARITRTSEKAAAAGRPMNPMLLKVHNSVQRSLQFIRWLRWALDGSTSWRHAMDELRPLMAKYLC